jgi:hypothetical protein
VIIVHGNQ